jgi:hypothetical protein
MSAMTTAEILIRAGTDREELGARVREAWIGWARRQPHPKRSWLVPFSQLSLAGQEADMTIGEQLFRAGWEAREAAGQPPPGYAVVLLAGSRCEEYPELSRCVMDVITGPGMTSGQAAEVARHAPPWTLPHRITVTSPGEFLR